MESNELFGRQHAFPNSTRSVCIWRSEATAASVVSRISAAGAMVTGPGPRYWPWMEIEPELARLALSEHILLALLAGATMCGWR